MKVETKCKIVQKVWLNPDTVYMVLEAGSMVRDTWKAPGQFVHIKCGEGSFLRRPISVCACMEGEPEDTVAIVFERRGAGTDWLARRACGEYLDVLGFSWATALPWSRRDAICWWAAASVCPPCGAAPSIPWAVPPLSWAFAPPSGPSCWTVSSRSAPRCWWPPTTAPWAATDLWTPWSARCLRRIETLQPFWPAAQSPCCAPSGTLGVPCQVSMEERMACGVGACLGCATPMADGTMKHVCKDGPIFPAEEVDWNA